MKRLKTASSIIGILLTSIGLIASGASNSSLYRKLVAPYFDPMVQATQELSQQHKITTDKPGFAVVLQFLQKEAPDLKDAQVTEITKLVCASLSMTVSACAFHLQTESGNKVVPVLDLENKIFSDYLDKPMFWFGQVAGWFGIIITASVFFIPEKAPRSDAKSKRNKK